MDSSFVAKKAHLNTLREKNAAAKALRLAKQAAHGDDDWTIQHETSWVMAEEGRTGSKAWSCAVNCTGPGLLQYFSLAIAGDGSPVVKGCSAARNARTCELMSAARSTRLQFTTKSKEMGVRTRVGCMDDFDMYKAYLGWSNIGWVGARSCCCVAATAEVRIADSWGDTRIWLGVVKGDVPPLLHHSPTHVGVLCFQSHAASLRWFLIHSQFARAFASRWQVSSTDMRLAVLVKAFDPPSQYLQASGASRCTGSSRHNFVTHLRLRGGDGTIVGATHDQDADARHDILTSIG